VRFLGGVLTYLKNREEARCEGEYPISELACSMSSHVTGLYFAGNRIIQPALDTTRTIDADGVFVGSPGPCGPVTAALFTGTLALNEKTVTRTRVEFVPIHLTGTLTCLLSGIGSVTVDIKDPTDIDIDPGDDSSTSQITVD
jgi:hypothetical protein